MNFLQVENKTFLISGVANKKSVAYFSAKTLKSFGAKLIFTVQNEQVKEKVQKLFPDDLIYILDVEKDESYGELQQELSLKEVQLDGFLHSIAFANLTEKKPFHETSWLDHAQADRISSFSLVMMSNCLKKYLKKEASVVAISISSTKAASYGYMGPIKASLNANINFLSQSFSEFSNIRFNSVCSGPLKTSASAGIPGYINNYLYAEQLTLRKKALSTQEVANTVCFLLSPSSSGINGTGIVVDAGINCNYFDQSIVSKVVDS